VAFASYRLIENSINMARQSIFKGIMTKWQQPLKQSLNAYEDCAGIIKKHTKIGKRQPLS